jgi:hypothetical protein
MPQPSAGISRTGRVFEIFLLFCDGVPRFSSLSAETEAIPIIRKMRIFLFGGVEFGASRHGTSVLNCLHEGGMARPFQFFCCCNLILTRGGYCDGFVGGVSVLVGLQVGARELEERCRKGKHVWRLLPNSVLLQPSGSVRAVQSNQQDSGGGEEGSGPQS